MDNSTVGRLVHTLAKYAALAGGIVLTVLVGLVVVSVVGRSLIWAGLGAITGDYELVEAGVGFAIFAFLPWAHLTRGHAVVAIFTDRLGSRVNSWILVICDALMLLVASFITWRLWLGAIDKFNYGETTLLLRMPLWWAYSAGLVGAAIFVVVAIYVLARSCAVALSAEPAPPAPGPVH